MQLTRLDWFRETYRHFGLACHRRRNPVASGDMKYADGPTTEVDTVIDAPIEQVWDAVTDINMPALFSTEFLGAEWVDAGPSLGARFVGRNRHKALGEWETISWVNRYEPPHEFGWVVSDPDNPSATWWFILKQQDQGVRVRQGGRMGPAPSGLTHAITAMPDKEERIVARRLQEWERSMRATLDGIKQHLEGDR
jgi:hypothetical protein